MDQFRQVGEVLGSLKALMVMKHEMVINQRQCGLLFDMFDLAFETISDEIRKNLRLDERSTKWKPLEHPLRELHRIFKEGELYIRYCLDVKDFLGKAISLHFNRDCVEFHIHNLLCCFPVVIEAIETISEFSVTDLEEMHRRRNAFMRKYDSEWDNLKLFQWMFGEQYLVPRDVCIRLDAAWKEDRWLLLEAIREKKTAVTTNLGKHEPKLRALLMSKLNWLEPNKQKPKLLPSSVLFNASDYSVKRRLGLGEGHVKEIQWLGESFALRTFFGEVEPLNEEISLVFSLSHPNILQYLCGFYDEERKEGLLLMELMSKNLKTYIKENSGQRKRHPFSVPVAVDIMLQIARGLEYLHSKKVYHGELNPSNILLKARHSSTESYFHVKLTGFGLISIKSYARSPPADVDPVIWYAPEVLEEQEQFSKNCNAKYSEKADVYSFGMLCFQLLTGKVPFDDSHLQGDKMVRNIRAGERPLFSYPAPKYLANLTRKCWHPNPALRPSFSAICRILRYTKMFLVINPDHGQPESPPPLVDYYDIEASFSKKFAGAGGNLHLAPVSQIPFQLYSYKIVQREKTIESRNGKIWDLGSGEFLHRPASVSGEENLADIDDLFLVPSDRRSVCSEIIESIPFHAFDQRTAISEIPNNIFLPDQRSIGSESPGRKSLCIVSADQRSIFAETPERKVSRSRSLNSIPVGIIQNPGASMAHSKSQTAVTEVPNIPEKEPKSNIIERKASSKKIAHRRKLSEIPEKGVSASLLKKPNAAERSSREASTAASSKPVLAKNSEKKLSPKKTPREVTIPKRSGISEDNVPRSSPAKATKSSSTAVAASPTRGPWISSTSSSSKGYMSAQSSPLHPCARLSRSNREFSLSSAGMSPRRGK